MAHIECGNCCNGFVAGPNASEDNADAIPCPVCHGSGSVGPYSDGFTHEAQHATFILMETFEGHVADAACAQQFPDVAAAADKVLKAMGELYHLIGSKMPEKSDG